MPYADPDKGRACDREYQRRRRVEDPEYLEMKRKSSAKANARRYAEDPEFRERKAAYNAAYRARMKARRTGGE